MKIASVKITFRISQIILLILITEITDNFQPIILGNKKTIQLSISK